MDMFNKLPQTMIENILCRIPIQEAARTSILAKEWRYHWTKIPKLMLDEDTFNVSSCVDDVPSPEERLYNLQTLRKGKSYWCKLYYAYYQILLKHEGPIDEFTLRVCAYDECVEIAYIVSYLLRNYSVKTLTLDLFWGYVLPLSVFSFQQLSELRLIECDLANETITSNVFDSLTSLYMSNVITTKKVFLHLFRCPLLKSLTIIIDSQAFDDSEDFDNYTITDLFECFPMVENLSTYLSIMEYFEKGGVPKVLPTALIHLKYLHIDEMSFMYEYGLPFLLFLIRSTPNMEKLKLRVTCYDYCEDPVVQSQKFSSTLIDCSDVLLVHLNELEILNLKDEYTKPALEFVKFIMAKSPVLKKVRISLKKGFHKDGDELQVSEGLLSSQSASPMVEIIVKIEV